MRHVRPKEAAMLRDGRAKGKPFTQLIGSSAFVVLSNKEQVVRVGLVRQRTPPQCVKDDFLGEASLSAVLH